MGFDVHIFNGISSNAVLDGARELTFVCILVLFQQFTHVLSYMLAKDMVTVDFSTEFSSFFIIAGESLFAVRNIKTTIGCAFHGTEGFSSSGGTGQSNVQTGTEGSGTVIVVFNRE